MKNFDQLAIGTYYVKSFAFRPTAYGTRLSVVLTDDSLIFLPSRFIDSIKEQVQVDELNKGTYAMKYLGKRNKWVDLDFEELRGIEKQFVDSQNVEETITKSDDADDDDIGMQFTDDSAQSRLEIDDGVVTDNSSDYGIGQNIDAYLKSSQYERDIRAVAEDDNDF